MVIFIESTYGYKYIMEHYTFVYFHTEVKAVQVNIITLPSSNVLTGTFITMLSMF